MFALSLQAIFLVFVLFFLFVCLVVIFLVDRHGVPGKTNCCKLAFSNVVMVFRERESTV